MLNALRLLILLISLQILSFQEFLEEKPENSNEIKTKTPKEPCNDENCPRFQGYCYKEICICQENFITFYKEHEEPTVYCNYKRKSRFTAFFLEFFFPFGIGLLYLQRTVHAMIKLGLFIGFFATLCTELCCISLKVNAFQITMAVLILAFLFSWLGLHVVDIVCIALGVYNDGNGLETI